LDFKPSGTAADSQDVSNVRTKGLQTAKGGSSLANLRMRDSMENQSMISSKASVRNASIQNMKSSVMNQSFSQHRGSMGDIGVSPLIQSTKNQVLTRNSSKNPNTGTQKKMEIDQEANREIDVLLDKMMRAPQIS